MNLSRGVILTLSIGTMLLFSGCAKGVQCRAPDNSIIHVEAFKDSLFTGAMVVKDRGNPFKETIFNNNIKDNDNVVTAEKSKMSTAFTWSGLLAPWQMKLDANNDTFQIGETIYSCDKGLMELVNTIKTRKK